MLLSSLPLSEQGARQDFLPPAVGLAASAPKHAAVMSAGKGAKFFWAPKAAAQKIFAERQPLPASIIRPQKTGARRPTDRRAGAKNQIQPLRKAQLKNQKARGAECTSAHLRIAKTMPCGRGYAPTTPASQTALTRLRVVSAPFGPSVILTNESGAQRRIHFCIFAFPDLRGAQG